MKWGYKSKAWLLLFLTLFFVQWVYSVGSKLTYNGYDSYNSNGIHRYDGGLWSGSCFDDEVAPDSSRK